MRPAEKPYRKLVLVCTNEREDGSNCCAQRGSLEVFQTLKARMKEMDPTVRVSRTDCLGNCATGTTVILMPDNVWLGEVAVEDVPVVIDKIIE
ncbi:(2Fe-2S) ferredoxin domain-containing protein [Candidatus Uhrbacteria bacterium]|nr:(2Fe-2S) ferredoxin domain-containing protein [Candidatus Uhrbacteria bacterium]